MEYELLKGCKVLIVEDDLSSRLYLNKILEKTGAVLYNVGNGKNAVDFVRKNPDINMILMDIQLPEMDGYMSSKLIREINEDIIIIAQTAYGLHGDKERIISSGFDDFLIKPILADTLKGKMISCLSAAKRKGKKL